MNEPLSSPKNTRTNGSFDATAIIFIIRPSDELVSRSFSFIASARRRTNACDDAAGQLAGIAMQFLNRRPNGFLGQSLNGRTVLLLVVLLDKTIEVKR